MASLGDCHDSIKTIKSSTRMNDDALLYRNNNNAMRRDATQCLDDYASKLKWKSTGERILDIGSGDGSVTGILTKYIPHNYEALIGCDINESVVKFANDNNGDEKTKFLELNIEGDIPNELSNSFDHIFSFYTLHWIRDQVKGFTNIYNLLSEGGECLLTFLARSPVYSLFEALTRTKKWGPWLTEYNDFVSPYHNYHNPDSKITDMLNIIGFREINVRTIQKVYVSESTDALKRTVTSVSPFKIPKDMHEDLMNDYIEVARDMRIVDEDTGAVTFHYNLIVIHCNK